MDAVRFFSSLVMHARNNVVSYCFRYRVFNLLIDIDRLSEASGRYWFFSVDRWNLLSFHTGDHLRNREISLRSWAESVLRNGGLYEEGLRIEILCMPRILGRGFDPISLWICQTREGSPVGVIAEVRNTFGERHCYLLRATKDTWPLQVDHAKGFHVSPFIALCGRYVFDIRMGSGSFSVQIDLMVGTRRLVRATQKGTQEQPGTAWLLRRLSSMLFQPLRVWGGIHWQALKIWFRGGAYHSKPAPPRTEVS